MAGETVQLLHEHYRDTCSIAQDIRGSRDRYFYLILASLVPVLFNVYSPADYARLLSEFLAKRLDLSRAPDLGFVRSLLWFVLFGLTVRYCQSVLLLERQYAYLHALEKQLARDLGEVFGREGRAYLANYPVFLNWAHHLYSLVFPVVLLVVVTVALLRGLPGWPPWPGVVYFDLVVGVALWMFVGLYLRARYAGHAKRQAAHVVDLTLAGPRPAPPGKEVATEAILPSALEPPNTYKAPVGQEADVAPRFP